MHRNRQTFLAEPVRKWKTCLRGQTLLRNSVFPAREEPSRGPAGPGHAGRRGVGRRRDVGLNPDKQNGTNSLVPFFIFYILHNLISCNPRNFDLRLGKEV